MRFSHPHGHRVFIFCLFSFLAQIAFAQTLTESSPIPTCSQSEESKQFDFWLGDWQVKLADGSIAGKNSIIREQKGCVLLENWLGVRGGSGISMNFYDQAKKKWVQIWTGSEGSQIQIEGGLIDGSMILVGKIATLGQDSNLDFRGTWTLLSDGRVRQFFEQSKDKGKSWQPWFEGFYSKLQ